MTAYARRTDPDTSHEAAASIKDMRKQHFTVLMLLSAWPEGATDEELLGYAREMGVPISDSGLRTRRSELVNKGLVEFTGEKKRTLSGRRTRVWRVADDE
jgi:hypothetical protein